MASSIRIQTECPGNVVRVEETDLVFPELAAGKEVATLITLRPVFSGTHRVRVKAAYSNKPSSGRPMRMHESPAKELVVETKY